MRKYPFTAIVGQEKLKQALLLCAINPNIGGVLIKGEKGTAKTTAVRGLAAVMPAIQRVKDSFFNTSPAEYRATEPAEMHFETEEIPVPFVDLPLGASEDRVLGSLDLEAMLSEKKRKVQPGLLAAAHRGILYIDEVNLLADHLVDILLDVAASGTNTIAREGISVSHPARFVLIGTMNPEEGNLRPQFLDRFGLMVEVDAQQDVSQRTEVVRRRMAFDADPEGFTFKWEAAQQTLTATIRNAQSLLPAVVMPDGLLTMISQLCIEWSVGSLRADIVMYKTATTLAALAGRTSVTADDIKQAAELVLIHRQKKRAGSRGMNPTNGNGANTNAPDNVPPAAVESSPLNAQEGAEPLSADTSAQELQTTAPHELKDESFGAQTGFEAPEFKTTNTVTAPQSTAGRRSKAANIPLGFQVRAEKDRYAQGIAVTETLVHAVMREPEEVQIRREDLHAKVRSGKSGRLILFVVDASGSMAVGKRMEAVKGSVMSLLRDAYQKRDRVGVIVFRGVEAQILLEPTSSIDLAERAMESLPTGGRTPLAQAMQLAGGLLNEHQRTPAIQPILIVLSDGKANVPLAGGGDPWQQTLECAAEIGQAGIQSMVLDTESGYVRLGRASELAAALGAEYLAIDELSAAAITETITQHFE